MIAYLINIILIMAIDIKNYINSIVLILILKKYINKNNINLYSYFQFLYFVLAFGYLSFIKKCH